MKKALPLSLVMMGFTALFVLGTVLVSLAGSSGRGLVLNESQILYLSSTSAQVVAAVYGLTLTGFIFFRSELSREGLEDETLRDAVESLKARYFALLLFITVLVIVSLLLANLTMVFESSKNEFERRLVLSAGQAGFLTSLLAISYFVFDVISPKRIERASKSLQSGVDPQVEGQQIGSLDEFLKNYEQIEAQLDSIGKEYLGDRGPSDRRPRRRIPNDRVVEILFRSHRIDRSLHKKLRDLITLSNAIIHGADPVVSEAKVKASGEAVIELKAALEKPIERRGRLARR
ncbi:MAG TPA: hypothetical protein VER96_04750 [Polyangiaceae bacterium]|nr:hypothetical protein [Polyangiaceae bacterium]